MNFHQIRSFSVLLPALAGTCLLLTACRTPAPPPPDETSVRPGINDPYLQPNLEVETWIQRLEGENREIYRERQNILSLLPLRPGLAVADIGAGTGIFVPSLAKAVQPSGRVYAVDIVPEFLRHIEERATATGLDNVETVLATERSVELPRKSIDLALLCDVYHHLEYPRHTLDSLYRALRPKGDLFLIDFKRIPGQSSDWILNHVRAGQEEVTAELEAAGFRKIAEHPILEENYVLHFRKSASGLW